MSEFDIIEAWMRKGVLGDNVYPREVGLYREIACSDVDMFEYMENNKYIDCYSSVFSKWQLVRREFDTLFIDVDGKNIDESYGKYVKVLERLPFKPSRVYASGRGFHIYIDFEPMRIEQYGSCIREIIDEWELSSYIDTRVSGDVRRMARIPTTLNGRVGKYVVQIRADRDISEIKEMMADGVSDVYIGKQIDCVRKMISSKDDKYGSSRVERTQNNSGLAIKIDKFPKCIKMGIERLVEYGELDHYWRLVIAIFLSKVWSREEIIDLFRETANDFVLKKTQYQVDYILRRKLSCYSCKKVKSMGICPYSDLQKCPFYVYTDGWLENMFKVV